ncbi:MAG: DUF4124 domain-containing protein [Proteobacteria bacterium]|nr:DUF4124 domain-containing protein [Pseudomonadota bacterium]
MRILIAIVTLLLMCATASAASDYYVWVDENGVTNYSQQNPQGYTARHISKDYRFGDRIIEDEEPTTGSRPGANKSVDQEPAAANKTGDDLIGAERASIMAKIAETKNQNCGIGKRNLAQLEAFARIRVKGPDGNERMLSDEEHKARIAGELPKLA